MNRVPEILGVGFGPNVLNRFQARRFVAVFMTMASVAIGLTSVVIILLDRNNILPPPPITATDCIDSKLEFLNDADLTKPELVAVGSSATQNNLDLATLEERFPGLPAINAAPCYLYMHHIDFFAEFLLARMPRAEAVLVVTHTRDFEKCEPETREVFDKSIANGYFDGLVPRWLIYLTGFRPVYFYYEIRRRIRGQEPKDPTFDDAYGSTILIGTNPWRPPPSIDERCFEALAMLRQRTNERGAELIVATVPVMPEWARTFDPTGAVIEAWTRRVAEEMKGPMAHLIDGRALKWDDGSFADPVHVLYPRHTDYTEFLASSLATTDWRSPAPR